MTPTEPSAGKSFSAWVLFGAVFGLGLLADLWSKAAVFDWLAKSEPLTLSRQILPGVARFTLSTNPGIVFGFDKMPPPLIVAGTVLAILVVVYFFATSPRRARLTHAALAMILAGALGNLYDRLFTCVRLPNDTVNTRQVRDFIDLTQLHYPWVFNVADVLLVLGVVILMLVSFGQWRRQRAAGGGA